MKAIVIREFGPPSVMKLEEVPTPEPGPGEVLIKVHAVSVNRTLDTVVRAGKYARRVTLPLMPGVDPSGVIAKLGPGVTERKVGDRVTVQLRIRQRQRRGFASDSRACTPGAAMPNMSAAQANRTAIVPDGLDFADRHRGVAPRADRVHAAARPAPRSSPANGCW